MPEHPQDSTATTEAVAARIRTDLAWLTSHWPDLLDPSRAAGEGGSAAAGSRVPLLTEALHLRTHIPTVLAQWCSTTARQLLICPTRAIPTTDVPALAGWLAEQAECLADHPTGADLLASQLGQLVEAVRRVVEPDGYRRIAVPMLTDPEGADDQDGLDLGALATAAASARGAACPSEGCPGALGMTLTPGTAAAIVCSGRRSHRWEQGEWVALAQVLGDVEPTRMTDAELAGWLSRHLQARVAAGTVRSWAARYPLSVRRDAAGTFDRIEVARWYIGWRARQHRPA